MHKISILLFLITFNHCVFSESQCVLTKKEHAKDEQLNMIPFGHHAIVCGDMNGPKNADDKVFEAAQARIVRGNLLELSHFDVEVLHHAHGYSLVTGALSQVYDKHLDVIGLNDFKGIQAPTPGNNRGSNPAVQALVNQIDVSSWLSDVTTLSSWSRTTGQAGNVNAINWISNEMNNLGLSVTTPTFNVGATSTNNILGVQTGTARADDWYLVGAHMDSVPSGNAPGALDNASGCAGVLEMARLVSQHTFEGTILFICFSGEEQGLIGSEFHADTLIANGDQNKIKVALTMDMVGYSSNSQRELLVESSGTYQWLMDALVQNAATYASGLTVYTSTNYFGSDHVSYIDNGMPGVLSIDDDWGVYPHYHRSSDLPEHLNNTQDQAEMILKTNLATIALMAGLIDNSDVIFENGFE